MIFLRIGPHRCPGKSACAHGGHGVGSVDASDRPAKRAVEEVEPQTCNTFTAQISIKN